jgi:hypothetical protein
MKVCERGGLRRLRVRVGGHQRLVMRGGDVEHRAAQIQHGAQNLQDVARSLIR